jgi:hypothetical protein
MCVLKHSASVLSQRGRAIREQASSASEAQGAGICSLRFPNLLTGTETNQYGDQKVREEG